MDTLVLEDLKEKTSRDIFDLVVGYIEKQKENF